MSIDGVILTNLGSPASPEPKQIRKYLREFLMDPRVIDLPFPFRWFLVSCIIVPFRAGKSAASYRTIWQQDGSPLLTISKQMRNRLQEKSPVPVHMSMRYGTPSIREVIHLHAHAAKTGNYSSPNLYLIPLYPQYAMSTYESVVVETRKQIRKLNPHTTLLIQKPFFDDHGYIHALTTRAEPFLTSPHDHLLFSFHSLPLRHIRKSDPTRRHCLQVENCCTVPSPAHSTCYRHQCLRTAEVVTSRLDIPENRYSVAFQSRMGRSAWLSPSTHDEIIRLARSGVKHLMVICPSFVTDCLETLEEIGIRGKNTFLSEGGEKFTLIPCLNDHPAWIQTLADWIQAMRKKMRNGVKE